MEICNERDYYLQIDHLGNLSHLGQLQTHSAIGSLMILEDRSFLNMPNLF